MMALPPVSQSSVAVSSATIDRIEQRQQQQARPQPHALGLGGEPRQQRHGLEHLQRARHEMLADHQRGEPARPRHPHLLDQVGELGPEIGALPPLRRHVETELHRVSFPLVFCDDCVPPLDHPIHAMGQPIVGRPSREQPPGVQPSRRARPSPRG